MGDDVLASSGSVEAPVETLEGGKGVDATREGGFAYQQHRSNDADSLTSTA